MYWVTSINWAGATFRDDDEFSVPSIFVYISYCRFPPHVLITVYDVVRKFSRLKKERDATSLDHLDDDSKC